MAGFSVRETRLMSVWRFRNVGGSAVRAAVSHHLEVVCHRGSLGHHGGGGAVFLHRKRDWSRSTFWRDQGRGPLTMKCHVDGA